MAKLICTKQTFGGGGKPLEALEPLDSPSSRLVANPKGRVRPSKMLSRPGTLHHQLANTAAAAAATNATAAVASFAPVQPLQLLAGLAHRQLHACHAGRKLGCTLHCNSNAVATRHGPECLPERDTRHAQRHQAKWANFSVSRRASWKPQVVDSRLETVPESQATFGNSGEHRRR